MRIPPDAIGGLFWAMVGLWIAYEGRELGVGSLNDPGSGLILFWTGLAMAVMSAGTMIAAFVSRAGGSALWSGWRGLQWRKLFMVMLIMIVYAVALEPVGFIPSTVVLLIVLFRAVEPQPWRVAIIGALVTTAVVYVVFKLGLGTQLPDGLLGRG